MTVRTTKAPRFPRARARGLTLVELVVVLAVVAILIGAGFAGLLSWLKTDNVSVARARLRTALQATMAEALTHPATLSTAYGNWSLALVKTATRQTLYVCSGSHGGCAGNTTPANGPVEVRVSSIPMNVQVTLNGASFTCAAFSPLGQPLLSATTPPSAASNACYWPPAQNGQWTFTFAVNGHASMSYVF